MIFVKIGEVKSAYFSYGLKLHYIYACAVETQDISEIKDALLKFCIQRRGVYHFQQRNNTVLRFVILLLK